MKRSPRSMRTLRLGAFGGVFVLPPLIERLVRSRLWKRIGDRRRGRSSTSPLVHVRGPAPTPAGDLDDVGRAMLARVEAHHWYHSMDLGHGLVTSGFVDHRLQLPHYDLPPSLAGLRCLDIATFDGFWAFEFERRGAAEVVALDIPDRAAQDFPRWMAREPEAFKITGRLGDGFRLAHEIYESRVQRVEKSVYDLDPEVDGRFDLVFISDVLVHLRDPQLAIERAYSVCRGALVVADVFSPELDALGERPVAEFLGPGETWWRPNTACLRQWMTVAGFEPIDEVSRFRLAAEGDEEIHKVVLRGEASESPTWTSIEKAHRAAHWRR